MIIHVVSQGDTVSSIAERYDVSVSKLIIDNGLEEPYELVTGQSIVIVYPELTYTVKEGDSLSGIADTYHVTMMQLFMNNPFLYGRNFVYPGETIVLKYNRAGRISTNGFAFTFINNATLRKTLPYLTYLSIFNYRATKEGNLIEYYDDREVLRTAKEYGTVPLLLITALSIRGLNDAETAYAILLDEECQNRYIENIIQIVRTKGYQGVNFAFQLIRETNQQLYQNFFNKISKILKADSYSMFLTVDPDICYGDDGISFETIDYSEFGDAADSITFMKFFWARNMDPPFPVSSVSALEIFLAYTDSYISPDRVNIAIPLIGYDWELPFYAGYSETTSLTLDKCIGLARDTNSVIRFDEVSQTPFFEYEVKSSYGSDIRHIVWFIDARSMDALINLIPEYGLNGTAVWNVMFYNSQLWLMVNSQFEIEKIT